MLFFLLISKSTILLKKECAAKLSFKRGFCLFCPSNMKNEFRRDGDRPRWPTNSTVPIPFLFKTALFSSFNYFTILGPLFLTVLDEYLK